MQTQHTLTQLLERWEEAVERGEEPDLNELCAQCPELLPQLKVQIAVLRSVDSGLQHARQLQETHWISEDPLVGETLVLRSDVTVRRQHREGGIGRVYVGVDEQLHREVAVKTLKRGLAQDALALAQFVLESEITGRLDHPGIVPVYGLGMGADGLPFYTMRFIGDETLDNAVDRFHAQDQRSRHFDGVEFRALLQSLVSVCKTIGYAHSRGVLHCDIKPLNVMLGRYGETLVVDWGSAASVGREQHFQCNGEQTIRPSQANVSSGSSGGRGCSPAYMSPEQASGVTELQTSSDIFNLGATLYKLLTGRPPYSGKTLSDLQALARNAEFPRPRQLDPRIPRPLEAICLRAMALRTSDRYALATDLATDIERYLADEPTSAYAQTRSEKALRWLKRHRLIAVYSFFAILLITLLSIAAAVWSSRVAEREQEAHAQAEQARRESIEASARFAAKMLAGDLENRWSALEKAALDPELAKLLTQPSLTSGDRTTWRPLQEWLEKRRLERAHLSATSWLLMHADGTQVARVPYENAISIGKNYAFRTYFHGGPSDLSEDSSRPKPIDKPHRSTVFESHNSGRLMMALSVPVWDRPFDFDRTIVGVLGMGIEVGQLDVPNSTSVVIVDLRRDGVTPTAGQSTGRRGLVLQHPVFQDRQDSADAAHRRYWLSEEWCQELLQLNKRALRSADPIARLYTDYQDVVRPQQTRQLAAVAPIVVTNQIGQGIQDVELAVIVHERIQDSNRGN